MLKTLATSIVLGAACVHGFVPAGVPSLGLRTSAAVSTRSPMALRMQEEEYKPLIPTKENPMAPDYKNEPTQFERQGLVESGSPTPKTYNPAMGGGEGVGGLTRRETLAFSGAVGVGLVGVLWAVTRNPGYDTKDTSRDAGNVELIKEEMAKPEVQASLKELKGTRDTIDKLYSGFKENQNLQLSASVSSISIVKLRDDLNKLTLALDEDTQIKTDKIVRVIIQDLVELEQAAKLKEGAARTPKRIAAVTKWFSQTTGDFDKFLAYFAGAPAAAPAK
mmetsp:Transcript_8195/g.20350  ORF Transcript_8195/g.20350 Transcript_8195/m.20350 type:complete len:277 (+) Transcript_8195:57-887(+)|eukprot:CAMPEP_0206247656 /NCGR_PEP_ID=MMETSP0047_2-20121206/19935_1 /ASSEMBLY_ACC=CAM_ASM_000192 /TAXON_ID=195065 /ORGANISM="Chroomonas mesostigmatica_cf, Strain CCMP1168" /LENGTH=276 /DNA_ID=CAMNT_0053673213 /DNA_START=57 /DNA_END=887 /DNA_ORIENTATION=+